MRRSGQITRPAPLSTLYSLLSTLYSLLSTLHLLNIVIHRKLQRMRTQAQRRDLVLAFVRYPTLDQPLGENVALEQEFVIVLKSLEGLVEAARQARHVRQF